MAKTKVASLLDNLSVARDALAGIVSEIDACIPEALKDRKIQASGTVTELENKVKDTAKFIPFTTRKTQRGESLQLVATSKSSLDMQMVEALVLRLGGTLEELEECRVVTKYWAIRKV